MGSGQRAPAFGIFRNVLSPWLIADASMSTKIWPGAASFGVGMSRTSSSRLAVTQIAFIGRFLCCGVAD
jgi:hypothetical protein